MAVACQYLLADKYLHVFAFIHLHTTHLHVWNLNAITCNRMQFAGKLASPSIVKSKECIPWTDHDISVYRQITYQ